MWDTAERIEAGNQLAVVISAGEAGIVHARLGRPFYPQITLHADVSPEASHVVLPLAGGTLGGAAATLAYPPRPFVPAD